MTAAQLGASARAAAPVAAAERLLNLIQSAGFAGRQLRRWLGDRLERFEVSESEFLVLWLCSRPRPGGGWVQGELAEAAGISPAQISSLVERLRQRGLMTMKRSAIDRRRAVWQLLHQGEDLLARIREGLQGVAHRLDALVAPEEQQAAARLFDRIVDAAERSAAVKPFDPSEGAAAAAEPRVGRGGAA